MVINGASCRNVGFWVKHLENDTKNDRAELREVRGLAADNLRDALLEMKNDARDTRCQNFMYQANFNPPANARLNEQQWDRMFEIFERHRGIPAGQPHVVIEHEKEGRVHRHVIWSRIIGEEGRAWSDSLDAKVCHAASREIAHELGLEHTISPLDNDREGPRPPRGPKSYEMLRGLRSEIDPRDVTRAVTAIFRESLNGADLKNGLQQHGYELVKGDRAFCIIDRAGDVHSLARRIEGVSTKELRSFMKDIDREALPTVEQARAKVRDRNLAERQADLGTVQREIAWEEALVKSAIGKEKIEGRFKEPMPPRIQPRAVGREEATRSPQEPRREPAMNITSEIKIPASVGRAAGRTLGKAFDVVASAFESLVAPQATPEQKREAEVAAREQRVENHHQTAFSQHMTELAQARQREEQEHQAHLQRERDERDR